MSSADDLASLLLVPENGSNSQVAQIAHRQELIVKWGGIPPGAKVLELGCGQGDCTIVIADLVGENGSVDAVDPAPPDYGKPWRSSKWAHFSNIRILGAPFTVEQAQRHISSSRFGSRITWIRAHPLEFLPEGSAEPKYDIGILAHCLWYFASPSIITSTLQRLSSLCKRIYIAEWSLYSSTPAAHPHVLSALTQASLECRKPESVSNVRTVISPAAIKVLAEQVGLKLIKEGHVSPGGYLLDGKWEVAAVSNAEFIKEVEENVVNEREKAVIFALRDAMLRSIEAVEGGRKGVQSMDVWCGVFINL